MRAKLFWRALLVAGLLAVAVTAVASAHTSIKVGPYTVEVGWVDEPPVVGVKNAVFISITNGETGKPVEGVGTLEVTVSMGGKERKLEMHPLGEDSPGQYAADFIPTRRGTYTVMLAGKIENTDVNTSTDIEEAVEATGLQFPEELPDAQVMSQALGQAQNAVNNANTTALIALAVGVVGVLLGGFALLRSRKS
jgi:hypothetical protein